MMLVAFVMGVIGGSFSTLVSVWVWSLLAVASQADDLAEEAVEEARLAS